METKRVEVDYDKLCLNEDENLVFDDNEQYFYNYEHFFDDDDDDNADDHDF